MQQNMVMLLMSAAFGVIAIIFTIVGVAAPGWGAGNARLFKCVGSCPKDFITVGVLFIIAIVILTVAVIFTLMLVRRIFSSDSDRIRAIVLAFYVVAAIFIIAAYSRLIPIDAYCYHLTVTDGALTLISAILFSYFVGLSTSAILR